MISNREAMRLSSKASWLSGYDLYLLGEGTHFRAYEKMGAHPGEFAGRRGVHFVHRWPAPILSPSPKWRSSSVGNDGRDIGKYGNVNGPALAGSGTRTTRAFGQA